MEHCKPLNCEGLMVTDFSDDRRRSVPEAFFWREDGSLVLAFNDHFGGVEDEGAARISCLLSSDEGQTWKEAGVLLENDGAANIAGPALLRLHSGRIALAYMRRNSYQDQSIQIRFGDDSLKNWSDPVQVTDIPGYHCSAGNRLIQLQSGRLVYPCAWTPGESKERVSSGYSGLIWLSDDEGATWYGSKSELKLPARGVMEPCACELADGTLLMLMRTQLGSLFMSRSEDEGLTWSDPRPTPLESPEACCFVTRIGDSPDIMAVWNNSPYVSSHSQFGIRRPLGYAISQDGGYHWSAPQSLEEDPRYTNAMPIVTFQDEWAVFAYYACSTEKEQASGILQCRVKRCRISDLYFSVGIGA